MTFTFSITFSFLYSTSLRNFRYIEGMPSSFLKYPLLFFLISLLYFFYDFCLLLLNFLSSIPLHQPSVKFHHNNFLLIPLAFPPPHFNHVCNSSCRYSLDFFLVSLPRTSDVTTGVRERRMRDFYGPFLLLTIVVILV